LGVVGSFESVEGGVAFFEDSFNFRGPPGDDALLRVWMSQSSQFSI